MTKPPENPLLDVDKLKQEIADAEEQFKSLLKAAELEAYFGNKTVPTLEVLGKSIGTVIGFRIIRSAQTGFPHLELTFTDRGLYTFNGVEVPGGTNATYEGFLDDSLVFYGQGNGMSVAIYPPELADLPAGGPHQRTYSTWFTEGVAKLEPTLTGAGTYRGSMLYRWREDGPLHVLNGTPAIFQLTINDVGHTFGTIWRWVLPTSDSSSTS
jgi:hypothetical protein